MLAVPEKHGWNKRTAKESGTRGGTIVERAVGRRDVWLEDWEFFLLLLSCSSSPSLADRERILVGTRADFHN